MYWCDAAEFGSDWAFEISTSDVDGESFGHLFSKGYGGEKYQEKTGDGGGDFESD